MWTAFVVLEAPKPEPDLRRRLDEFKHTMERLDEMWPPLDFTKSAWDARISALELSIFPESENPQRNRRGLVDIIGVAASRLFGLATEEQVKECRRYVERAASENKKVMHSFNDLVTVVNKSYEQIHLNRQHITALESYVSKLQDQVLGLQDDVNRTRSLAGRVFRDNKINEILSGVETIVCLLSITKEYIQDDRASFEYEWKAEIRSGDEI